jgi:hypothetical protein
MSTAEDRVVEVGHVANGPDVGDSRLEALVHDDAVLELDSTAPQ